MELCTNLVIRSSRSLGLGRFVEVSGTLLAAREEVDATRVQVQENSIRGAKCRGIDYARLLPS